jgi:uncharacterized phage-associated protein
MLKSAFQEAKATQVAAMLLSLGGGKMNYMKLIKLMYLVDRAALLDWGRPITHDYYFSLPNGPILSTVLDLINGRISSDLTTGLIWREYISEPQEYNIQLKQDCNPKNLSKKQVEVINQVFNKFGQFSEWNLRDYTHDNCSEWQDPLGSRIEISYHDILSSSDISEEEIEIIESELADLATMGSLLTSVK